jgi:hypothetical protein
LINGEVREATYEDGKQVKQKKKMEVGKHLIQKAYLQHIGSSILEFK